MHAKVTCHSLDFQHRDSSSKCSKPYVVWPVYAPSLSGPKFEWPQEPGYSNTQSALLFGEFFWVF